MKKITAVAVALFILMGSVSAVYAESRTPYLPDQSITSDKVGPYFPAVRKTKREQSYVVRAVVDVAIARPLGLGATVLGSVLWVAWLPFTAPTGSMDVAAQGLVVEPFRFTFVRPIGELK